MLKRRHTPPSILLIVNALRLAYKIYSPYLCGEDKGKPRPLIFTDLTGAK